MKYHYAVIFDMDGVVVDNFQYHQLAWQTFCKRHGLDFGTAFRSGVFGGTNRDHLEHFFGRRLAEEEVRNFEEEKEALYRDLYHPHIKPVEGLAAFLQELKSAGIPVALATSSPPVNVRFVLAETGLSGVFNPVLDATSVTNGKPDPEIYLKTAAALAKDPAACIVFEDSISGITAARAAGMKVVGLTTTHPAEDLPVLEMAIPDFTNIGLDDLELLF